MMIQSAMCKSHLRDGVEPTAGWNCEKFVAKSSQFMTFHVLQFIKHETGLVHLS